LGLRGFRDFFLYRIEVEACALLHGRKLDGRHGQFRDILLYEHVAPKLVLVPTLYIESSESFVASTAASIATGWSEPVPGRDHGAL
jgi:hypothetical protein